MEDAISAATSAQPVAEGAVVGTPAHGEGGGSRPATPRADIDRAVADLRARQAAWMAVSPTARRELIGRLRRDFLAVAERWAAAASAAAGLSSSAETMLTGPYFVLRNLRLLAGSLADIAERGAPRIPGPVRVRPDGRVTARIFPQDLYDRIFYGGVTAEAWMQPGVTAQGLASTQAVAYRRAGDPGGVALVLGAGNVSSIVPLDALYKLFIDNRVVLYKTHPVNDYLGPLLDEAFRALSADGFFRLVYGGAAEGAYLCSHPGIDEIHITGSDKTYEAIVFGSGGEGRRRKASHMPLLTKPISAELGNVSPVIVVPDPPQRSGGPAAWSAADIAYHAENLATSLTNNAGFNCNATRVIIQHAGSPDRGRLLDAVRAQLARLPPRPAYYPGSVERYDAFVAAHPEAERLGGPPATAATAAAAPQPSSAPGLAAGGAPRLPWTLIAAVDPAARGDICFTTEAFCGLFAATAIAADSVPQYIERAVAFANDTLWGTLNVTLLVSPAALADPEVAAAVEGAIAALRYGTVSVNHWAAIGYGLGVTPWGAYPGHTAQDIQSGTGVVHNTLMFSRVEKSVVRAPFHAHPKPAWFASHRTAARLMPRLARFEAAPSPTQLPAILALALRG